jgi:hypothetical protein
MANTGLIVGGVLITLSLLALMFRGKFVTSDITDAINAENDEHANNIAYDLNANARADDEYNRNRSGGKNKKSKRCKSRKSRKSRKSKL